MGTVRWAPFVVATVLFVGVYVGILSEKVHRTIVTLSGAALMLVLGEWLGFYSFDQAIGEVDFNTLILLLGMMIVVRIFKATGYFEYLAIIAAKLARGRSWLLMIYLAVITAFLSMILDNVTTVIILAPITFSIADILGLSPIPFLMGEVLLSNVGGVATLIGDPPNILIGSAAGLGFNDFLVHLGPIVLVAAGGVIAILLIRFHRELLIKPTNVDRILEIDARGAVTDWRTTKRMLIVIAITIMLFILHEPLGLAPGIVALVAAALGLLWVRPDLEPVLKDIHWDVLLFFASLFVIVGGLDASGVLNSVAEGMARLTQQGTVFAALVVLWGSALMSGLVDNVPFTIVMLPVIGALSARGVETSALWWALALGVGFGGNATPVGATANVIVMSMCEHAGSPITTKQWLKTGMLTTVGSCLVASLLLVVALKIGWM
ncbi:ArsB/NhaD family transporter [Candidatus Bipolaricaulota bacterium]|nr:ArsB/NhaD family transporter [Candidatus Bipolaricaulota bacterium]